MCCIEQVCFEREEPVCSKDLQAINREADAQLIDFTGVGSLLLLLQESCADFLANLLKGRGSCGVSAVDADQMESEVGLHRLGNFTDRERKCSFFKGDAKILHSASLA